MAKKKKIVKKKSQPKNEPRLVRRLPTFISGFDNFIEGGFKEGSINLLAGGPGSGKTIFCLQFLVNGIIKAGETAIYITFEERRKKLYDDLLRIGIDLEHYEKEGKFIFLEYSPEQVKKLLLEGGGTIDAIIHKSKASRIVVDSISSFAMLYQDELSRKEAALALFELIEEWGLTALLTEQAGPRGEMFSESLEFEADSIIIFYHAKIRGERQRGVEILKMRGTKIPRVTYAFHIKQGGLHFEKKKLIFS